MNTRLILIRHAQAEGNVTRRFHGWTDSGITDIGHKQAERTAERLRDVPIDFLYSSSMKRAVQTAEYIAKVKKLPIIQTDKLKEINGGDWEGNLFEELPKKWPKEHSTWEYKPHLHKMPNGESMVEFQERVVKEIQYIVKKHPGKNICVVTHGTVIKVLLWYFHKFDLEEMVNIEWYDNTSITILDYDGQKYTPVIEGDASHLGKELSTLENQGWWQEYIRKFHERQSKREES